MTGLYEIAYNTKGTVGEKSKACHSEVFIADSNEDALEIFNHYIVEKNISIIGIPTVKQTYIETYQISPDGVFGPRPRSTVENTVLMSRPTVGCCSYFAGPCACLGETTGEPVSEQE